MNDEEKKQPLTRGEFSQWISNDYNHLVMAVSFIKGQLYVLIPLVMAILAGIAALIYIGMA